MVELLLLYQQDLGLILAVANYFLSIEVIQFQQTQIKLKLTKLCFDDLQFVSEVRVHLASLVWAQYVNGVI